MNLRTQNLTGFFHPVSPVLLSLALAQLMAATAVRGGTTNTIGSTTLTSAAPLSIASGNATISTGTLFFNANTTGNYTAVAGPGTLILGATTNSVTYPDIYFNNNDADNSTANWGTGINAPVSLGTIQRVIHGKTNHSSADKYGTFGTDCTFNGPISGSAGLTFIAQDSYTGSNPMEVPFCLNATNTFTGMVQIQRGSVYLGTNNAFPAGNVLQFNVAAGNNGKFFLYGRSTTVSDLSSTGAGTALIANGNRNPSPIGPATLTITANNSTTYAGTLIDTNVEYANTTTGNTPVLSVIKNGPANLTLSGTLSYSGSTAVNAGKLYINSTSATNTVTVNNGGTLAGSGSVRGNVLVASGGALEAGSGGAGKLTLKNLTLGTGGSDAITLNLAGTSAGLASSFSVTNANGFTNNGTTTINISGTLPATNPTNYNLLTYSGAVRGSGTFVLGSIPSLPSAAYLTNNTSASAIQLVVPVLISSAVTWVGAPTNNWDLSLSNVWVQSGTATPTYFTNGNAVTFDDTATNFTVNVTTIVKPVSVTFSNLVRDYTVTGPGVIDNVASLTKLGAAKVTLATTNSYTGSTTITAGTLALGAAGAIPSGVAAGSVVVNGTLDLAGYSATLNNLSGTGVVDNVSAGGNLILTVSNSVNSSFTGALQNSSGSVALNLTGPGTMTLDSSNTYSGGTTIAGGALIVGAPGGLGSGPVNVTANLAGGTANILTVATGAAASLSNNLTLPNASGTYVLTKNQSGPLTLAGFVSGGGSGLILRTTTDTAGDATTVFEFVGANAAYAGSLQTYRGVVQVDNPLALGTGTIYGDANNSTNGDLLFNTSMTFTNSLVLQSATSLSSGTNAANSVVMTGNISGGPAALTKYGPGALTLAGNLSYNGNLIVNAGTLSIGSLILAGDTTSGGGLGAAYTNTVVIAAGATLQSSGTLSIYESSALKPYIGVTGAGTLALTATNNNANSPDISFAANDTTANSTANWGCSIVAPVNLGSVQRYIWGRTDHTSVDVYGCLQADCQFGGPISGSGGLTFVAQNNSVGSNGQLMETPFCLNAVNTFTGPVEIQRGSVYLGTNVVASPFPSGNVLRFNVASGNSGKFFLYGHNTTVSDLSSTGAGSALIANGNRNPSSIGPVTLTVIQNNPATYAGTLVDTNLEYAGTNVGSATTLSLIKSGPATLTLTGPVAYSGTLAVNAGKLFVNTASSGSGTVTVNAGGTLGGNGSIAAAVTVTNGAALEAGGGTGLGSLTLKSLALGANPATDAIALNCEANPAGVNSLTIQNVNGLTNNATVTVNVTGVLPALTPATYTIVSYAGSIRGSGSFVLGSLPNQAVAYLTNNTAAGAIQLVVSSVIIPSVTWVGDLTNNWDLLGLNVWKQTGTAVSAAYADNDTVVLDDSATNYYVNLAATVTPNGMLVSNNVNAYTLAGAGGISGYTGLTKDGTGTLTLNTTNNYSGPTVITAGTVVLGTAGAIPGGSGAGNVTVNGKLDFAGYSPALNNLSGSGVVDNVSVGGATVLTAAGSGSSIFSGTIQNTSGSVELDYSGSGVLSLSGTNTYSGATVINSGSVQVGTGGSSGTLGAGAVLDMATLAFNRSDTYTNFNDIAGTGSVQQNGGGTLTLLGNLTYSGASVVNAGVLAFPKDHTFDVASGTTLNIAAGAIARISGTVVNLNVNPTSVAVDATGAGTMQLASLLNSIESYSDLNIGPNHSGTTDYGCRLACNLDLGSVHRTIYGWSGRNDVARLGLTGCDCQFAGTIMGTAELTLRGQNSFAPGTNTMEVPFAFNGSNSFTGPLEIQRGSVYLGNVNALTQGNVLIFDPAQGVNSRLFLYGFNASISDLQSTAYGTSQIANGNGATSTNVGPATLTVTQNNPFSFNGNISDWFTEYGSPATGALVPTLTLIKNGLAALTLTGSNTFSGPTTINAGKLYINNSATGGGAITVNTNATLGGSGVISSLVTVKNGGAIESGAGNQTGNLLLKGLTLGSASGDRVVLNLAANALLNVTNNNGLVLNGGSGSVTINVGGNFAALGQYPLLTYKGSLGGSGFAAFQLGSLPAGVIGTLSNNTANASVDLVVAGVTVPRWSGALSSEWSVNTLAAPKNWVLNSDGVTAIDYVEGEAVLFNDSAANPAVALSIANVSPYSVLVSNSVENYSFTGSYGITGSAALTKQGSAALTLATTNTYTGNTTISAGTLVLGAASAIPGGTGYGNLAVNGSLDLHGFSPTLNNLSGNGTVDNLIVGGSPVLSVMNTASTVFAGKIQNTTGSLAVNLTGGGSLTLAGTNTLSGIVTVNNATLNVTGKIGSGGVAVTTSGTLGGTGVVAGPVSLAGGASLVLTANNPLTVGALALNGKVTVSATGTIATNTSGTYLLLKHGAESGSGSFALVQLPWLAAAGLSAQLVDTNNQLSLVVQPAALTGSIADVKHVVVFMQENRSFDHYFGTLHGVHGFSDRSMPILTNGNSVLYQPSGASYELPYHTSVTCINDTDHSWGATHNAINNGRNDGWIANKGTETMAYYNRSDLAFYYQLADAYTILDDYHCSVLCSTDPNRVALMTGMIDPNGTGAGTVNGTTYPGGPLIDNTEPSLGWGPGWVTYPELLLKAGISWKIYQQSDNYDDNALAWFAVYKQAAAGNPLHDNGNVFAANVVTQFQNDVTSNTLPAVSWIIGPTAQTEHPPYSSQSGEALTKQFLDALASNPSMASNTVFILCYDENDGFYDHELPINPPAGTPNEFVSGLPIGLGIRVPAIIISPWTRGGHVCSQVFDHTSILRFLETWTGVQEPNISSWRRQVTGDLTSAFDFAHPDYTFPSLPSTTPINCSSGSTPAVPSPQVVPVQEAGTLSPRPLPYQPNALPVLNAAAGNISILLTNSGAASVHFLVVPNAYRTDIPTPYDVLNTKSATNVYSTTSTAGKYDLSCYGPNGFLRRFAGNVTADANQIESLAALNPATGGMVVTLANATASPVTFTVTNGYATNSQSYLVPAYTTNVVSAGSETNSGYYDLTVTCSADSIFLRRFVGRVETNGLTGGFVSAQNPSGYRNNANLTLTVVGYGTPTGAVQFQTNGVTLGSPVSLSNGSVSLNAASLPRGTWQVTAFYSGDLLNSASTNSLIQTITNHPPVAGTAYYARAANVSLKIAVSDLLSNVTDADGDPITLVGVGADGLNLTSTNGTTLVTNSAYIFYTNSVTPNVIDSFSYTVSDSQGGTVLGNVVIVMSNSLIGQTAASLNVTSTNVAANFFGWPGYRYVVERSTNLVQGSGWVPLSTNTAPGNGLIQVQDGFQDLGIPVPPGPSAAYYRLRYNP